MQLFEEQFQEAKEARDKRWADHDQYQQLCEMLWIPQNKRCAIFGSPDFYEHTKRILATEEYQYRIEKALKLAEYIKSN